MTAPGSVGKTMTAKAAAGGVTPAAFAPTWLSIADVKTWLRINAQDTADDDLLNMVTAAAEPYVQRCRPEFMGSDGTYTPDAEAYQGAVMYTAREYRRRNSPAGVELFGDQASFVARYDVDIERALHTGAFAPPIVS